MCSAPVLFSLTRACAAYLVHRSPAVPAETGHVPLSVCAHWRLLRGHGKSPFVSLTLLPRPEVTGRGSPALPCSGWHSGTATENALFVLSSLPEGLASRVSCPLARRSTGLMLLFAFAVGHALELFAFYDLLAFWHLMTFVLRSRLDYGRIYKLLQLRYCRCTFSWTVLTP